MLQLLFAVALIWMAFELRSQNKRLNLLEKLLNPKGATQDEQDLAPYAPSQEAEEAPNPTVQFRAEEDQPAQPESKEENKEKISLEQLISTRLGVWVGAAALILGALFLIKYSIDEGWISPAVRLILSGLFGVSLVAGAAWVEKRPGFPNAARVMQALAGAGFAALYGTIYAAYGLYDMLPALPAFIGMGALTAVAIVGALHFGKPLAFLGLIGGLVTPLLIHSNHPAALPLFSYLFALDVMALAVASQRQWWGLAQSALAGSLAWAIVWAERQSDELGLISLLFLFPLLPLTAWLIDRAKQATNHDNTDTMGIIGGTCTLTTFVVPVYLFFVARSSFDAAAWGSLFATGAALLALAHIRPLLFGRLAIPLLVASMTLLWFKLAPMAQENSANNTIWHFSFLISATTLLYAGAGLWGLRCNLAPARQGWLITASLLLGYFVALARIKGLPIPVHAVPDYLSPTAYDLPEGPSLLSYVKNNNLWGVKALSLSAFLIWLADLSRKRPESLEKNHLLAAFSIGASALLSTAIVLILPSAAWPTGLSLQAIATLWIYRRTRVDVILIMGALVLGGVCLSSFSRLWHDVADIATASQLSTLSPGHILADLLVPGLALLGGYALHRGTGEKIAKVSLGLGALFTLLGLSHGIALFVRSFGLPLYELQFETLLFLCAAAFLENHFSKSQLGKDRGPVTLALLIVILLRLTFAHAIQHNPLFSRFENAGEWPVLNAGFFGYILPLLPLHFIAKARDWYETETLGPVLRAFMIAFFLNGGAIIIRQAFHGTGMDHGLAAGVAEELCYSALGLLTGLGLLALAMKLKDAAWRWASLIVILGTTGKVFLIDAADLNGLWRVLSFIGLGLSLIGLSAFYSRFVFKKS